MNWHWLHCNWGKWETYTETWVRQYYNGKSNNYSIECQRRTCLTCGKQDRREI